jgi:hypothetical protein
MIATYLTLAGMLLLVISPLLIPVTLTVMHFAVNKFGHSPSRETVAARTLPGTVLVLGELPGAHRAPAPA